MWNACCIRPSAYGLVAVGCAPGPSSNPSPRPSIPRMLSNEWFSMTSTTTCSMVGMVSVPAGRSGKGSESGRRKPLRPRTFSAAYCGDEGLTGTPPCTGPSAAARSSAPPDSTGPRAPAAAPAPAYPRRARRLSLPRSSGCSSGGWGSRMASSLCMPVMVSVGLPAGLGASGRAAWSSASCRSPRDRVELPAPGHPFQDVLASVIELNARANHEILDGARDKNLVR